MRIIISFYTVKPNSVISDRKLKKHGRGPCFLLFSESDFDDVVFAFSCQGAGVVVGVAEGHGHHHFSFAQPFVEFFVGEEDVADPKASDAHGGGLEGHVFGSGADGLYVGKFMDFFCGGPVVCEGTAVGVYYKYQYRSLLHALQGEAGVGVELRGTGQDAFAFFGSFNALFHEGKGGLLAFPFHHDEFLGLAVLGRGSPHAGAEDFTHVYFGNVPVFKETDASSFENQVVHSISTFPCILISDYAFFIIHRFRWFVGENRRAYGNVGRLSAIR